MRKYVNADILAALESVMKLNTKHYQSDFEYDRESIIKAAQSPEADGKALLWMSRRSGTWCFSERSAFIDGTPEHSTWINYQGASENIAAFAVEIAGMKDGKPVGTLYELDYNLHAEHVKKAALPAEAVSLTFEDGSVKGFPYREYNGNWLEIQHKHGKITDCRYEVKDEAALQEVLKQERAARSRFPARSLDWYLKKLSSVSKPSAVERLEAAKLTVKPPASSRRRAVAEAEL